MKLKNKVAIITGAATGIGRATAVLFAKEGAKTVLADVNVKEANETVKLVKSAGGETMFVETDVSKEADVKRMVEKTMEKYGRIDILVNNAGVVLVKPAEETTEQDVDRVISVNFKGVFFGCKHVIPIMKRQGGGVIVNIASVSGHIGQVNHAVYGGTKGGVIAMSRALAVELAPFKIRVN
ncbi:MAG: SDR family NAD(P)-dependent oxidoreductase, partial [Candidatus Freyarchaeota archaeon]